MAATQGHGNPDWTRDETLLALNLYLQCGGQVPGPTDPRVLELSAKLRALPVHRDVAKRDSFRNPAGVAFKLQNIRQVATGRGLANVSAVDREVWRDFASTPQVVSQLAEKISTASTETGLTAEEVASVEADEEFFEGRVITALHRTRERSPKARQKLLKARIETSTLRCDACSDGPKTEDPLLMAAGFEAHHIAPLAASGSRTTKLSDLALLCATCHRLIHRAMHQQRRWLSVPMFQELLTQPAKTAQDKSAGAEETKTAPKSDSTPIKASATVAASV